MGNILEIFGEMEKWTFITPWSWKGVWRCAVACQQNTFLFCVKDRHELSFACLSLRPILPLSSALFAGAGPCHRPPNSTDSLLDPAGDTLVSEGEGREPSHPLLLPAAMPSSGRQQAALGSKGVDRAPRRSSSLVSVAQEPLQFRSGNGRSKSRCQTGQTLSWEHGSGALPQSLFLVVAVLNHRPCVQPLYFWKQSPILNLLVWHVYVVSASD